MILVPKNQLQIKFEEEKQQLERYGHVSSLTFEEWLTIKGYTKIEKKYDKRRRNSTTSIRTLRNKYR